jgi:hypothetical protein
MGLPPMRQLSSLVALVVLEHLQAAVALVVVLPLLGIVVPLSALHLYQFHFPRDILIMLEHF